MLKAFRHNLNFSRNQSHKSLHQFQNKLAEKFKEAQLEEKTKFWLRKYEDLFGITKLTHVHERVLQAQKSIEIVQEKRRKVQEELFITQKKLQESRDVMYKTPMGDSQYITIVTKVHELLKEQKNLQETFAWYDQTEREQQTSLALAINNSQDHERTYREKNKYLSLLTGIVGALLGLVGSSITSWRYRKNIKLYETNISDQVALVQKNVDELNSNELKTDVWVRLEEQQKQFSESLNSVLSLAGENGSQEKNAGSDLDLQFERMSQKLENNLNLKLKSYTSVNVGAISGLVLLGSFLMYFNYGS
ncbi:hypothetical protein JTE90_023269 [Oedothorax gibbosus]|uniref:Coiled-coil domain-containing protein 51 n=1 Tax=Oedothorax gibbosus TaxID=931172 RepID=A0AAV6U438_9ARAC|nr:hypothetical protein JTE90_023269 [Oedothorax gibbosus]